MPIEPAVEAPDGPRVRPPGTLTTMHRYGGREADRALSN
jgi:hypothetical protein